MTSAPMPSDPLWPRAGDWIARAAESAPGSSRADLALIGIPACRSSITPTSADETPAAVRKALRRYSTYAASRRLDVSELAATDLGDVRDPDGAGGEERVREAVATAADSCDLLIALGGDNSVTYSVVRGLFGTALAECGLVTLDAHHDVRDGESNGSPIRRLVEAGLPGDSIVQVGIADFSNSAAYARRAAGYGITAVPREELRLRSPDAIAAQALDVAGRGGRPVFVDVDVDVCDRAEAPACPSAAPGGISANDLRRLVFAMARDPRVRGFDITEIDAAADAPDQRTVRLAALLVLEAAAGLLARREAEVP